MESFGSSEGDLTVTDVDELFGDLVVNVVTGL
jgi:hypothetical protein